MSYYTCSWLNDRWMQPLHSAQCGSARAGNCRLVRGRGTVHWPENVPRSFGKEAGVLYKYNVAARRVAYPGKDRALLFATTAGSPAREGT